MKTILFLFFVVILVFGGCRNKNPNISKEELVAELGAEEEKIKEIAEIPEGYTPPPGIKFPSVYQYTEPVVRLDILSAISNIQPVKMSDLGNEVVYRRIGEFEYGLVDIISIGEQGYLVKTIGGVWLLNKNFQKEKEVFKEEVEVFKSNNGVGYKPYKMINSLYYDKATNAIRCSFMTEIPGKNFNFDNYTGTILVDELLAGESPLDIDYIKNRVKIGQSAAIFPVGNNYGLYGTFIPGLYIFSAMGDTLCHFKPGNEPYTEFKSTVRGAERTHVYLLNNQATIRIAFNDTVFRILDTNTFQPAYKIDLGKYQVSRDEGMGLKADLSEKYLLQRLIETDNYLFIRITKDYDTPNNRKRGTVKYFQVMYDKQSRRLFSLPNEADNSLPGYIPNDIDNGLGFWPTFLMDNKPYMTKSGKELKEELSSEKRAAIPCLQDITDDEIILITLN